MVVVIDNYDSFTYNLVQRLGEIDSEIDIRVFRNDEITLDQLKEIAPSRLLVRLTSNRRRWTHTFPLGKIEWII